ncbi:MAG: UvrD-helicase domain-containing protein, partial [Clostridia bacterium]|nr:UvrD-helicase domain-containing protein [Clostridia bacterium]
VRAVAVCRDISARCDLLLGEAELFGMAERAREPLAVAVMPRATKAQGEDLRQLKFLSACSKAIKELCSELKEIGAREEESARCRSAQRRAAALADLAVRYDAAYSRLKREANVLDYDDLEHFALKILRGEAVRAEIAEKYRFVFVDEYQDVNPVQEEIVTLSSGEELFLVGDAKQAIYGFRGSKSEYFERKERELEHALRLTSNFRSAASVLEAVNGVFAPLFNGYAPMRGGDRYGDHRGCVRFHSVREEEKEKRERSVYSVLANAGREETDALAERIAALVEEEYGSQWYDADEEEEARRCKPVTYGDIAVLVRKNTGDAERIVRALSRRGIPVTTSSKTNVCDCFEARLLIDWLSYLDNREQDIPLAAAMLSAIGGFTDSELAAVRARFPSPYTFRAACSEYRKKMADGIAVKLKAFEQKTRELRTVSAVRSAAEILNELLAMGLEAQIAAKNGGRARLARVRRLVAEAEGCGSIHSFLTRLKASDYRVEYAESGGDGAVKVLTMHASKGLEYPVVILASLDGNFHGAERDELMYTERLLVCPRCYDTENKLVSETLLRRAAGVIQREEELKQEKNLLYVAMTRAKYRLHMMFGEREHALSPDYAKRFSDFIDFSACADYFSEETAAIPAAPVRAAYAAENRGTEALGALAAVYAKDYLHKDSVNLPVKSSATELIRESAHPMFDSEEEGKGYTAEEGLAYHAFLENVEFGASAKSELDRMRARGILSEEQLALLGEEKLNRILEIPCIRSLAGKRLRREQTFLVRLPAREVYGVDSEDEIVFQGAIDLLCETQDGYLIIDYKYSAHGDTYLREQYGKQLWLYKKAVARALRVDEKSVSVRLVNVARCREIEM